MPHLLKFVAASKEIIDGAVTIYQTAPFYGFGQSEELIGEAINSSGKLY